MNKNLFKILIDHDLINTQTIVCVQVKVRYWNNMSGDSVSNINWSPKVKAENIQQIEGMTPERFASSYNIKPDGTVKSYKKRGRKPKHALTNISV